jgi:hypothetical protein
MSFDYSYHMIRATALLKEATEALKVKDFLLSDALLTRATHELGEARKWISENSKVNQTTKD